MASQNQRYRAGEAKGQAEEKTQQTGSYVSEKAGGAKEKASQMGQSMKETAEAGKEKSGGLMQRTGEQVKNMAQGAADKVKQSFGMAGSGEEEEEEFMVGNTAAATGTTTILMERKERRCLLQCLHLHIIFAQCERLSYFSALGYTSTPRKSVTTLVSASSEIQHNLC
ncbi:hypothetical protein L1887_03783 [Cichorium endivia]|nr:hypothetical protein L1887_03783 [Cichorium endivia]